MNQAPETQNHEDGTTLLRESALAERWNLSLRTVQRNRSEGLGPPYIRLFGSIRYRLADVIAYEESHLRNSGEGNP